MFVRLFARAYFVHRSKTNDIVFEVGVMIYTLHVQLINISRKLVL